MARDELHIVYDAEEGDWVGKKNNAQRASFHASTKAEAIERGQKIGKNQGLELIIHKQSGEFQSASSYDNDPCPPKDRC